MDSGQILETASSEEFFLAPKHERTKQFLASYFQQFSYSI
jgi:ABC-type antimicrobial peptide transport system ATPase subunit